MISARSLNSTDSANAPSLVQLLVVGVGEERDSPQLKRVHPVPFPVRGEPTRPLPP